jgi:hypothetical protein
LILHLELEWQSRILEKFCLEICQVSTHIALQITYILYAALEDFQPEDNKGIQNLLSNHKLFMRCAELLENIECAVVYNKLNSDEININIQMNYHTIRQERSKTASNIIEINCSDRNLKSGKLFYKRGTRKLFQFKRWKPRWFKINKRILLCYGDENFNVLKRAIPLEDCIIREGSSPHHKYSFEIFSTLSQVTFRLYCEYEKDYKEWLNVIHK